MHKLWSYVRIMLTDIFRFKYCIHECVYHHVSFSALSRYLNQIMDVDMPPNQSWHCSLVISLVLMTTLSSTLFILNMTFDRFYSIIRPHKAASFNTVKKAKIIIISSVVFSIIFNLPHFWINLNVGRSCIPHGRSLHSIQGKIYYWLSFIVNFIFPFISLLIMNSVIIHTLRKRSNLTISEGQCQGQGQTTKMKLKNSERQIYSMLLLVTFGFLTLTTPVYFMTLYVNVVNFRKSPFSYAGYFLFYQVGQKTFYTNYGINFYLYVISGQKFRADLVKLFKCNDVLRSSHAGSVSSEINTVTTTT